MGPAAVAAAGAAPAADAGAYIARDGAIEERAGLDAATAAARVRSREGAPTPEPNEASRFDATQHPDRSSAAEREAEALQRIGYWHSRGERYAALLALLIADDGAAAPWPAWRAATAGWPAAGSVRSEVQALGPAARLQTFETLVQRTAEAGDGRTLWRSAGALATTDAARLRLWVLRRGLRPPRPPRLAAAFTLEALAPAAGAAMVLLAPLLGIPATASHMRPGPATLRSALRLRHLHPMQRPRLVRQWLQAAQTAGRMDDAGALLTLALACRLLDSPVPPAVVDQLARQS
jgi:hypothetical protein